MVSSYCVSGTSVAANFRACFQEEGLSRKKFSKLRGLVEEADESRLVELIEEAGIAIPQSDSKIKSEIDELLKVFNTTQRK